ncbi:MAG TPA: DUF736 family protein [Rhizomicrobium sp.]
MAIIGIFSPTKDGGWSGYIRTLTVDMKVRFVPNDNRNNERAPAFRVLSGRIELGAAWLHKAGSDRSRDYLSVQLDDPWLSEPVSAALFEIADGAEAQLVWNRRGVA